MTIFEKATIECGFREEEYHGALPPALFRSQSENNRIYNEKHTDLYDILIKLMAAYRANNLKDVAKYQRDFEIAFCYYEDA